MKKRQLGVANALRTDIRIIVGGKKTQLLSAVKAAKREEVQVKTK